IFCRAGSAELAEHPRKVLLGLKAAGDRESNQFWANGQPEVFAGQTRSGTSPVISSSATRKLARNVLFDLTLPAPSYYFALGLESTSPREEAVHMKETTQRDLFPGALEMMILRMLKRQPMHGYALVQDIKRSSQDLLQIEEGSLYPALQRLLEEEFVKAEWGVSSTNR